VENLAVPKKGLSANAAEHRPAATSEKNRVVVFMETSKGKLVAICVAVREVRVASHVRGNALPVHEGRRLGLQVALGSARLLKRLVLNKW